MDFFTWEFLSSLLLIIGIDLILAGDNAIVIGLAARRLPKSQQKKAVIYGTVGAVAIRVVATMAVVTLLKIPGLHLIGGLLLLWIAYKLLIDNKDNSNIKAGHNLWAAVRTIIIADALMGLDNVLAIAGAANDSYLLVGLGLIISVPIIMWGSTLFIKLIEHFSWIIYLGSAVLAFTAGKMITAEPFLNPLVDSSFVKWTVVILAIAIVLLLGIRKNKSHSKGHIMPNENRELNM